MKEIESIVSPLIKTQFPEFYATEGARFIDFVQQYYVWMESQNQAVNRSRSLFDYRDIDKTSSEFVGYFKNKYLNGFPLTAEANTQFLIKHATDIYSTKGTSVGIELTMRALFNESAAVHYPSNDLFKTSDGVWVVPVYLELSVSSRTKDFIGKQIIGSESGAVAFLEALVTKRVAGKHIQVAYLSGTVGNFKTGEFITPASDTNLNLAPFVIGSMTSLTVQEGGANFAVGDIFEVNSSNGKQGKARVTSVNNQTGKVNFIYIDALTSGGWGYSIDNSQVLVAQKMLQVANVQNANAQITGFAQFEGITQTFANIGYNTARPNNANFAVGAVVENYYANGVVAANAVIVATGATNNTTGFIVVAPYSGNVAAVDTVFAVRRTGNTFSFNANSGVANATEIITTSTIHQLANNDQVTYTVATGNTAIGGLTSGTIYYVVNAVSGGTTLQLSTTLGGAAANITAGTNETGHTLTSYGSMFSFNANSGVANTTEFITTTSPHTFANGDIVIYSVATGNTALAALSEGAAYCIINANTTAFNVADSSTGTAINLTAGLNQTGHSFRKSLGSGVITAYADRSAIATAIKSNTAYVGVVNTTSNGFIITPYANIVGAITNTTATIANTSTGTGATFSIGLLTDTETVYLTPDFLSSNNTQNVQFSTIKLNGINSGNGTSLLFPSVTTKLFNANSGVANTTDIITTTTAHGFVNTNLVYYRTALGNTVLSGLSNNTPYYVINAAAASSTLQLSSTSGGAAINLTAGLNETGHSLNKAGITASTGDGIFGGFGFQKYPNSSIDSVLLDCLRFDSTVIGSIATLTSRNTGSDYNVDPFVVVLDTYVFGYQKHDYLMTIAPLTGAFVVGEQILQTFDQPAIQLTVNTFTGTAANGTVSTTVIVNEKVYQSYANGSDRAYGFVVEAGISAGSGTIKLANVAGTFVTTSNGTTQMKSLTTGGTANISLVTSTTLATSARGIVKEAANSSFLKLKRINLESTFGVGNTIIGQVSGSTATIVNFDQDLTVPVIGVNANIYANVQTANAVATGLSVYDSGFGYINKEVVTLTKLDSNFTITAIVELGKQGTGAGYYTSTNGFLDSDKKLHDNDYYQEYSYEVISKIPFDRYVDVLKQVMHVAGTKAFGKVDATSVINASATIINTIVIS
jgi:hypothetical protein